MKNIKWKQLLFALATTFSFVAVGISLAMQSTAGILISAILAALFMATGFISKKKLR